MYEEGFASTQAGGQFEYSDLNLECTQHNIPNIYSSVVPLLEISEEEDQFSVVMAPNLCISQSQSLSQFEAQVQPDCDQQTIGDLNVGDPLLDQVREDAVTEPVTSPNLCISQSQNWLEPPCAKIGNLEISGVAHGTQIDMMLERDDSDSEGTTLGFQVMVNETQLSPAPEGNRDSEEAKRGIGFKNIQTQGPGFVYSDHITLCYFLV